MCNLESALEGRHTCTHLASGELAAGGLEGVLAACWLLG